MTPARRALVLANVFNLLVAIYFIIISIVSLIKLRWYHQLTVTLKVRHVLTTTTSYLAFLLLLLASLIFVIIFFLSLLRLRPQVYHTTNHREATLRTKPKTTRQIKRQETTHAKQPFDHQTTSQSFVLHESAEAAPAATEHKANCCSTSLHLISAINLVIILVVWLLNTGELVRESLSSQLDIAFAKYQFTNRSNHYSVAIDGMQDINNCCGQLDYTDFPHQRISGLSSGHYPGSCCGKNIFGVNARVHCVPEEIVRAKQTTGCVIVLANYYDLISLLVVPVALASLFVNITMIALSIIPRARQFRRDSMTSAAARFELKS